MAQQADLTVSKDYYNVHRRRSGFKDIHAVRAAVLAAGIEVRSTSLHGTDHPVTSDAIKRYAHPETAASLRDVLAGAISRHRVRDYANAIDGRGR